MKAMLMALLMTANVQAHALMETCYKKVENVAGSKLPSIVCLKGFNNIQISVDGKEFQAAKATFAEAPEQNGIRIINILLSSVNKESCSDLTVTQLIASDLGATGVTLYTSDNCHSDLEVVETVNYTVVK